MHNTHIKRTRYFDYDAENKGNPEGDDSEEKDPLEIPETPETPEMPETPETQLPPETTEPHLSCEWSYEGDAPTKWGDLKRCFPVENKCGDGKMQSPIRFITLHTEYSDDDFAIKNYHLFKKLNFVKKQFLRMTVDPSEKAFLLYNKMDGVALVHGNFTLREMHFHTGTDEEKGSEHALPHGRTALEVQFVHVRVDKHDLTDALAEADNVVVIAVLYKVQDTSNPSEAEEDTTEVDAVFEAIATSGDSAKEVRLFDLLGEFADGFYIYKGSLTYPPCTEGVRWLVNRTPLLMQRKTMKLIRDMVPKPSSRIPRDAQDEHQVKLKTFD